MRLSLKSVGIEFDHVSLRRSAIGKVVEELGVVIQARLYVTPRSRAGVGVVANVELRDELTGAPKLSSVSGCSIRNRVQVDRRFAALWVDIWVGARADAQLFPLFWFQFEIERSHIVWVDISCERRALDDPVESATGGPHAQSRSVLVGELDDPFAYRPSIFKRVVLPATLLEAKDVMAGHVDEGGAPRKGEKWERSFEHDIGLAKRVLQLEVVTR